MSVLSQLSEDFRRASARLERLREEHSEAVKRDSRTQMSLDYHVAIGEHTRLAIALAKMVAEALPARREMTVREELDALFESQGLEASRSERDLRAA